MKKNFYFLPFLLLVCLVIGCNNKKADVNTNQLAEQTANLNQAAEIKPVTEEEYQSNVLVILKDYLQGQVWQVFNTGLESSAYQGQLQIIAQMKEQLLDLVVPGSFRHIHLDLVFGLIDMEEAYQKIIEAGDHKTEATGYYPALIDQAQEKFEQGRQRLEKIINETSWLQ